MAILLLVLGIGSFAYLWWRWSRTTLTRSCRWRQDRAAGLWRCTFCGAELRQVAPPRVCLRDQQ